MSTKSSIGYIKITEEKMFHVYHEHMDGRCYLETNKVRIELPKILAHKFGKAIKEYMQDINVLSDEMEGRK